MKTNFILFLTIVVVAPLVFGVGRAPNDPYICEQTFEEGYMVGSWVVIDPNGLKYVGNKLTRTWTKMPLSLDIYPVDCNSDLDNLCQGYTFDRTYIPTGTYVFEFYDQDTVIDGPNNVSYSFETWTVTQKPDTEAPVPACGRITRGGE